MTDKELLELAARAAGFEINWQQWEITLSKWDPLTDDGDALRLAVKLGLPWESGYALGGIDYWKIGEEYVHHGEDTNTYAATRRAIVRAAAEIGKEMK